MSTIIRHDPVNYTFFITQDGYPEFSVCEGYMQLLVDAFLDPKGIDPNFSLFKSFCVTQEGRYLILERSNRGKPETLMKLTPAAAKRWALAVEKAHGAKIRSYAR